MRADNNKHFDELMCMCSSFNCFLCSVNVLFFHFVIILYVMVIQLNPDSVFILLYMSEKIIVNASSNHV